MAHARPAGFGPFRPTSDDDGGGGGGGGGSGGRRTEIGLRDQLTNRTPYPDSVSPSSTISSDKEYQARALV